MPKRDDQRFVASLFDDIGTDGRLSIIPVLQSIPDGHAADLTQLSDLLGVEKLVLIGWLRSHSDFARLVARKISANPNSDEDAH